MENKLFCQSCGIPISDDNIKGSNKDNSLNSDYCKYCYKEGTFTKDVTMDEMINISLEHMKKIFENDNNFNEQEALENMKSFFPQLKRWK